MTSIKKFFDFIQLPAKLATIISFCCALAYVFFVQRTINVVNTLFFLVGAISFAMSVTAINNHIDKRNSAETPHFSTIISLSLIATLLIIGAICGVILVVRVGISILLVGGFCFFIGIFYSFGPMPISSSPFGEVASALAEGFALMSIVLLINGIDLFSINLVVYNLAINIDLIKSLKFIIVATPISLGIANIMLANNICDIDEDRGSRLTLPMKVGVQTAVKIFQYVHVVAYLAIIVAAFLQITPPLTLLTLTTIFPVTRNIAKFTNRQVKSETFVNSIKNYAIINGVFISTILIGTLLT